MPKDNKTKKNGAVGERRKGAQEAAGKSFLQCVTKLTNAANSLAFPLGIHTRTHTRTRTRTRIHAYTHTRTHKTSLDLSLNLSLYLGWFVAKCSRYSPIGRWTEESMLLTIRCKVST